MKNIFYLFISYLFLSGCCSDIEEFLTEGLTCRDEVFTETKTVSIKVPYTVETDKKFFFAASVAADDIRKALKVPETNFTVKQIELTSGKIEYNKYSDNTAAALFVSIAIRGNTFNQTLLTAKEVPLPLIDIPEVPLISKGVKINEYLDTEGIKGFKQLLRDYVLLLNDDGIDFLLLGEASPPTTKAHFTLYFTMTFKIVYEVCRYVPMGEGERVCD